MMRRFYATRDIDLGGILLDVDAELDPAGHVVSYRPCTVAAMEPEDSPAADQRARYADRVERENDARLHGLMATLALPATRGLDGVFRRIPVEIEIAPDRWAVVEDMSVDADGITFAFGTNGHRIEYRFLGNACPAWRRQRPSAMRVVVER